MSRRRIALGVVANGYDRLVIAACQLLLVPVLVRGWGAHLYGCWLLLSTLPSFLALGDLGFGVAASVRMTTLLTRGDRAGAIVTFKTARALTLLTAAVVLGLAGIAVLAVPAAWLPSNPALPVASARVTAAAMAVYATLVLQFSLQAWALRALQRVAAGAVVGAHVYLLESAVVAAVAWTGHGPALAAGAMVLARLTGIGAQAMLLTRAAPWLPLGIGHATAAERRRLTAPALHALLIPLGQATVLQGSVVVLGAAAGPAATPAFAAARTLSRIGLQATQLLAHAMMPEFTAAAARGDNASQRRMLWTLVGTAVLATAPLAAALGWAGPALVRWWTHGAIVAAPSLMAVMAVSVVLTGLWTPLSNLMLAVNRQDAFAGAYVAAGAVSLVLTAVFAGLLGWGATGAALGVVALDGAMVLLVARFAWRHWLRQPTSGGLAVSA